MREIFVVFVIIAVVYGVSLVLLNNVLTGIGL